MKRIAELEAKVERLSDPDWWRQDLPGDLDACMDIAIKLNVGWFRCIGYVLQDLSITDFDQNHIGYEWGEGCHWKPLADDPDEAALLEEK